MIIHLDLPKTITLANIKKITLQNKHIDIQYYFVQDYVKD
jgi:hypothetical protein